MNEGNFTWRLCEGAIENLMRDDLFLDGAYLIHGTGGLVFEHACFGILDSGKLRFYPDTPDVPVSLEALVQQTPSYGIVAVKNNQRVLELNFDLLCKVDSFNAVSYSMRLPKVALRLVHD